MTATTPEYVASEAGFVALQAERDVQGEHEVARLSAEYAVLINGMRETFDSGRTKDLAWRRSQLEGLIRGIQQNHEAITACIGAELGGTKIRGVSDIVEIVTHAHDALANLVAWTSPVKKPNDFRIDVQASFYVRPEPKGVLLCIAPWNFPFLLSLSPLVGALAAGNCVVIKPSEFAPRCATLLERIVKEYLDTDCIKVVQGAVAETKALLEQRWDHIIYTGNGAIGRIVMHAAARHLTPVTLELGGKSPVIVDKTANMKTVVNRTFAGKAQNQGQVCIAPDYVIIDESRKEEFVTNFIKQVRRSNVGEGSKDNPNWGKIINARHVERLKRLIETSGGNVRCGGSEDADAAAQHVPLTVITDVSLDAPIMREEIFGPILPVIAVKNMDDGIKMVKSQEHPLALYIFSEDKAFQERVLRECTSGGAAVNTCIEHKINKQAPFGGVGGSGMGRYQGKYGFDEFSHLRTILYKTGTQPFLPHMEKTPPWLYDVIIKATVTGFVKPETKQKFKMAGLGILGLGAALVARSRL
mmetsp:Transcript_77756/g.141445  ORF Transcript_77756/g.141445 Transcript_77756/m.141445 type:complete len:528 (+) Transcript_77756:57-1640(+)